MVDPNRKDCAPHDEAEELLPWYATGRLDETDRQKLESHLSSCEHCRRQLVIERRLVQEFQAVVPEVESGWARIRGRIAAPARSTYRAQQPVFQQMLLFLSRPAVAALAAAQLAFLVVAGSLLFSLSRPSYHALGSAPVPASANLVVVFKPQASMQNVASALKATGASIVEGPTESDAYLLHVPPEKRQIEVARLQSNVAVQLAQPIDGVAQ